MMDDLLLAVVRANLAASAAILLLFALRKPAQKVFGAETAYGLWLIAPLSVIGSLAPAPQIGEVAPSAMQGVAQALKGWLTASGLAEQAQLLLAVWLGGALGALALMIRAQARFNRRAAAGAAGPALVGAITPRFVTPSDYRSRFTPEERAIVREHERTHHMRGDLQANVVLAALQVVAWFNPLVHMAASAIRFDQELACDASMMRRFPRLRRLYAETLLKTQLSPPPAPMACGWSPSGLHPLEVRVALLKRSAPSDDRIVTGGFAVAALSAAAVVIAWCVQPPLAPPTLPSRDPVQAEPSFSVVIVDLRAAGLAR